MLVKLKELCSIRRGSSPRPIQDFLSNDGMPWVKISDATRSTSRFINSTEQYIKNSGVKNSVVVHPGDLILSNSATPGLPKFMGITACIHDGWLLIDNLDSRLNKMFLYYNLLTIQKQLNQKANGSVFLNLKTDIVKDFEIELPTIEKQLHIVNILGSIDEKIENNEQKITKTKELMAHLYQNISLDKECVKIGDLTSEVKERLDDRSAKAFSVINSGELVEQDSYFDRQIHSKDMYKYKVIRKYDFAYNPSRINIGSVAMFEHDFGAVSPIYIAFSCDKKYSYYINEFIKTEQFNKEICLRANGSVRQSVNYDVFVEIEIPLPDDNELTKFNNEYTILQENIDSLKNENTKLNNLKNLYLKKFFG